MLATMQKKKKSPINCWWEYDSATLENSLQVSLNNDTWTYNMTPHMKLSGIYCREMKMSSHTETYASVFRIAFSMEFIPGNSPMCFREWVINQMLVCLSVTRAYYSAIKRNTTTWINLREIMLSERRSSQKVPQTVWFYSYDTWNDNTLESENRGVATRLWGRTMEKV